MRAVLRLPAFRLLFAGLAASMVGDALLVLVFAIWVKSLTGSNGAAGLVTLFMAVPYVLAPLGGWLVDRFRHRPFLVVANLASALMLIPLFAVRDTVVTADMLTAATCLWPARRLTAPLPPMDRSVEICPDLL